jgi:hypothetical protein
MNTLLHVFPVLLLAVSTPLAAVTPATIDFESGTVTKGGLTTPGYFSGYELHGTPSFSPWIGTNPTYVRLGSKSMGFEVRPELTWFNSERSEIRGPYVDVDARETVWYGFSVYLSPDAFDAPQGAWFIFNQQWQDKGTYPVFTSPPVAFSLDAGLRLDVDVIGDNRTSVTQNGGFQYRQNFGDLMTFQRGVWYDFVYRVKWDPAGTGSLLIRFKRASDSAYTTILDISGKQIGYNNGALIHWKAGIYRGYASSGSAFGNPNNAGLTQRLWIDHLKRGNTEAEVTR